MATSRSNGKSVTVFLTVEFRAPVAKNAQVRGTLVSKKESPLFRARIIKEKAGMYFSLCPSLGTFSQGKTQKAAKDNLAEATQLIIESHLEGGSFAQWMEDKGIRLLFEEPAVRTLPPRKTVKAPSNTSIVRIPDKFPAEAYC